MISDYIDYDKVIISMLKRYPDSKITLHELEEELAERVEANINCVCTDKDVVQSSILSDDVANRAMANIDMSERIKSLKSDITRIEKAWGRLDQTSKIVLEEFYQAGHETALDAVDAIRIRCKIEQRHAYRLRDEAIKKLKYLMYG